MLYQTLNQPLNCLIFFVLGIFSGLLFDFFNLLKKISKDEKFANFLFDFLSVIFSSFVLITANIILNYGQFRLYVLITFFCGLLFKKNLSKFLLKLILKIKIRKI